jgi:predicted secreted protein
MKPPLRIKSVSTKVSEEEFAALEARAQARKLTLSEWVRAELLEPRGGESGAGTEVLLGEVLALRTILMNLLFSISNGKAVTPEAMRELIEKADSDKERRAMERLTAVRATGLATVPATVPEPEAASESAEETGPEEGSRQRIFFPSIQCRSRRWRPASM